VHVVDGDDGDRHAWERPGTFEVAAGVHRIPLPLPGDGLKAVNVYAIPQSDGVTLIDAGWAMTEAREHLETGLAALDHDLGSVRRVLVTHLHRDHYEQGVQLQREFGSRLELGVGERPSLEEILEQDPPEQNGIVHRLRVAGAGPLLDALARFREQQRERGEVPDLDWSLPDHWLADREVVELEDRRLEVVHTPGHTQGHVVFVDREAGVLFSGDHVLPHITPSIGFEKIPVDSALADYLASLALVRGMPDLELLPAHGPVRPTTHDRVDELVAHHEERLRATAKAVADGNGTGYAVASALGWTRRDRAFDDLDPFNQMLAVNETLAHLDVLVRRDDLGVVEVDGVRHYTA
jgi:glyoxylase-like metal-dependent hydrolase (beta-lactamase superfamily II)